MLRFKQTYNSFLSTLTFLDHRNKSASEQPEDLSKEALRAAEHQIQAAPTSAKAYLSAGELYRSRDNLIAALHVYRQGLQHVPTNDAQYAELQKEKENVSATLYQRNRGFHQLLPYDILCLIFSKLEFRDLLRCTGVCQAWGKFMIEWPAFWEKLSDEMPQMQRSTLDPFIRRQAREFRLDGPLDDGLVHDILMFLAYSDNHFMEKLSFNNVIFTNEDVKLLAGALKSTSPPVKRVEFFNCTLPMEKYIDPVLSACSSMEYVSFSRINTSQREYGIPAPKKNQVILPKVEFSSLTYLKIALSGRGNSNVTLMQEQTGYLSGIIRRSPNLLHLFLDSSGGIHQGHCLLQALKYCPLIQNLVVSDCANMPETIMSAIDDSEYETPNPNGPSSSSSRPPITPGLRRLVLSGGSIKLDKGTLTSIFKRVYKTLELLYLHYDGTSVSTSSFYRLAYHGAPRLREIRVSTEDGCGSGGNQPPIAKALTALFSWCPALEVIELNDTFCSSRTSGYSYICVDDEVLKAIAENCPYIRHIKVCGRRAHTRDGMLYFASTGGTRLTYLEIDLEVGVIYEVVIKLQALQTLHRRVDSYYPRETLAQQDRSAVERILRERGGALVLGA